MNHITIPLCELFQIGSSKRVLKSEWKDAGVPFYRGREVTRLAIDGSVNNELFIAEEHYAELSKCNGVPTAGDIIITAIGTIGNSYIVQPTDRFYFKDASILWMKRNSDVLSEFVNLWLKSPLFFEQLDRGNGATVDTLTIKKLQSVRVRLPSLAEQQRIVAILDEAFEAIAVARSNAEQNRQNARALFESYLQSVFSQRGEGWVEKPLEDLIESNIIGLTKNSREQGEDKTWPYVKMNNITRENNFDLSSFTCVDATAEEVSKFSLRNGDFLFNTRNSHELVGKSCIYESNSFDTVLYNNNIMRIRFRHDIYARFILFAFSFKDVVDQLHAMKSGTTNVSAIYFKDLKSLVIPVPPISEQKKLSSKLAIIATETKRLESLYQRKIAALDELKQSLSQQAFSGQL
ncbi:restriction endonuclease subunit S [Aeromonas bestiarum]|uniref:Restriction endonuclease subunit S n=1 Tax=Aeromonas bestiarum TaxID=105751 RepID=A0AAW7HVL3_9GAMM|nr:restriction endonuclease subunit S [Aeromonas bestiarum]MDM5138800.1 restriction endonuclease subunit S [Aeromonas bestiarum]